MARSIGVDRVHDASENHLTAFQKDDTQWEPLTDSNDDLSLELDERLAEHCSYQSTPPLTDSIAGLAEVLGELKEQLKQSTRANEILESDLAAANAQLAKVIEENEGLQARVHETQEENSSFEDLRAELDQIARERDTLADKVHDIGLALTTSEKRVYETTQLLDRFRAERNEAVEEAACLDSQFSRAMKVIEELRGKFAAGEERESELEKRVKQLEHHLDTVIAERDAYRDDLADSLQTLDEVRQSILAVSREPKPSTGEE